MLRTDFYTQPRVGEVRAGFGQGLVRAAQANSCTDLLPVTAWAKGSVARCKRDFTSLRKASC